IDGLRGHESANERLRDGLHESNAITGNLEPVGCVGLPRRRQRNRTDKLCQIARDRRLLVIVESPLPRIVVRILTISPTQKISDRLEEGRRGTETRAELRIVALQGRKG